MTGKLYVVGTPIGNLSDFSPRAAECLRNCDFIAAEDTRVTLKLLNRFDIKKPLISYFEHNRRERGEIILARILGGESCALVTDAGMPAISDPGQDLVDICIASGVNVVSVPGPTAFATAVALSGLPSGRFTFEGFLSVNKQSRAEHLDSIKDEKRTTLKKACEKYENIPIKGEFVLVIEGAPQAAPEIYTVESAVAKAREFTDGGMSKNEAAKNAAKLTGIKKSDIYKLLTEE